jgi:hypothetical protein
MAALAVASPQSEELDRPDEAVVLVMAYSSRPCDAMSDDVGFSHIPHGEIEVRDGSGRLLGVGRLDDGSEFAMSCEFITEPFVLAESSDGYHEVTVGTDVDDTVIFTEEEIQQVPASSPGDSPYGFWINFNDMNENGIPDNEEDSYSDDPALKEYVNDYLFTHVPKLAAGNDTGSVTCRHNACVDRGFPDDMGGAGLDVTLHVWLNTDDTVASVEQTGGPMLTINQ